MLTADDLRSGASCVRWKVIQPSLPNSCPLNTGQGPSAINRLPSSKQRLNGCGVPYSWRRHDLYSSTLAAHRRCRDEDGLKRSCISPIRFIPRKDENVTQNTSDCIHGPALRTWSDASGLLCS